MAGPVLANRSKADLSPAPCPGGAHRLAGHASRREESSEAPQRVGEEPSSAREGWGCPPTVGDV